MDVGENKTKLRERGTLWRRTRSPIQEGGVADRAVDHRKVKEVTGCAFQGCRYDGESGLEPNETEQTERRQDQDNALGGG